MAYNLDQTKIQEVTIKATYLGQQIVNVLHYGAWGAPWVGAPTSQQLLSAFLTNWGSIVTRQVGDLVYSEAQVRQVVGWQAGAGVSYRPLYNALDSAPYTAAGGQILAAGLPSYVAVTARKRTSRPGRRYRGSTRYAGIPEADTVDTPGGDANRIKAITLLLWQTASDTVQGTDLVFGGLDVINTVVFSLRDLRLSAGPGPIANTVIYSGEITSAPVNPLVGSQVSRKARNV